MDDVDRKTCGFAGVILIDATVTALVAPNLNKGIVIFMLIVGVQLLIVALWTPLKEFLTVRNRDEKEEWKSPFED